jgi:hypothetical protein
MILALIVVWFLCVLGCGLGLTGTLIAAFGGWSKTAVVLGLMAFTAAVLLTELLDKEIVNRQWRAVGWILPPMTLSVLAISCGLYRAIEGSRSSRAT